MSLSRTMIDASPPWRPAMMIVAALHVGGLAWMMAPPGIAPASEPAPGMPPIAIVLAPPASALPSPPDMAVAPTPPTPPQAAPRPDVPMPDVIETARGTLAKARPVPPMPVPDTRAPLSPPSVSAAAPPPSLAPPAKTTSALAEGASSSTQAAASWESQVMARLAKAKRYPDSARIARQEDRITISFTIDATGKTGNARIVRSDGYEDLEQEALALVRRVSPLPPPPGGTSQRLSLPIDFYLRP